MFPLIRPCRAISLRWGFDNQVLGFAVRAGSQPRTCPRLIRAVVTGTPDRRIHRARPDSGDYLQRQGTEGPWRTEFSATDSIPRNRNLRVMGVAHATTDTAQEQETCTAGGPGRCDHLRGCLVRLPRIHHSSDQRRDDHGDVQCASKLFRRCPDSVFLVLALGHQWQLPELVGDIWPREGDMVRNAQLHRHRPHGWHDLQLRVVRRG